MDRQFTGISSANQSILHSKISQFSANFCLLSWQLFPETMTPGGSLIATMKVALVRSMTAPRREATFCSAQLQTERRFV
jgi:hypothetical protein